MGAVEQFVHILGVAIEEEGIFVYFTVYRKIVRVKKFACTAFECNDLCVIRKTKRCVNPLSKFLSSFHSLIADEAGQ